MAEDNKSFKPGWRRVKFGDVVQLSKEHCQDPLAEGYDRFVGLEHIDREDLRIRRWGQVADGTTFTTVFKPGQVLFGRRRAYQRKAAVADFAGVCSGDIYVLESKDNQLLLSELLPFLCQTEAFFDHAVGTSAGSLSPRTKWTSLAGFEFMLPPVAEQRKIIDLISATTELDAHYWHAEQMGKVAINVVSYVLFSRLDKANVIVKALSEVCIRQSQSGIYKGKEFQGRGVNIVNMGELFGYDLIDHNITMQRWDLTADEIQKYALTANDLLFGRRSLVLEGAGKCSMVGTLKEPTAFESSLLRITLNSDETFVFEWFNSPQGSREMTRIRSFTTVAGISGSDLRTLPIPIPDIETQRQIYELISRCRVRVLSIAERRAQLLSFQRSLRESLLGGRNAIQ